VVAAGRSERDVARDIDAALDRAGFSEPAFPRSSRPAPTARIRTHGRRTGGWPTVTWSCWTGGVLDGYCVDLTRMAAVGQVSARARAACLRRCTRHRTAAIETVRAGVTGAAVDAAGASRSEARGLADAFLHSTGHGLGLRCTKRLGCPSSDRPSGGAGGRDGLHDRTRGALEGFAKDGWRTTCSTADGCDVLTEHRAISLVV
jgi:Xaa-Pro aminopeptidase